MSRGYVQAIDQSATGSTALLVDHLALALASALIPRGFPNRISLKI
jgi:hypothetical protein